MEAQCANGLKSSFALENTTSLSPVLQKCTNIACECLAQWCSSFPLWKPLTSKSGLTHNSFPQISQVSSDFYYLCPKRCILEMKIEERCFDYFVILVPTVTHFSIRGLLLIPWRSGGLDSLEICPRTEGSLDPWLYSVLHTRKWCNMVAK